MLPADYRTMGRRSQRSPTDAHKRIGRVVLHRSHTISLVYIPLLHTIIDTIYLQHGDTYNDNNKLLHRNH